MKRLPGCPVGGDDELPLAAAEQVLAEIAGGATDLQCDFLPALLKILFQAGTDAHPQRRSDHDMPPSTLMVSPVMYREASLARKSTTSAISSGVPNRPSAARAAIDARRSGDMSVARSVSV